MSPGSACAGAALYRFVVSVCGCACMHMQDMQDMQVAQLACLVPVMQWCCLWLPADAPVVLKKFCWWLQALLFGLQCMCVVSMLCSPAIGMYMCTLPAYFVVLLLFRAFSCPVCLALVCPCRYPLGKCPTHSAGLRLCYAFACGQVGCVWGLPWVQHHLWHSQVTCCALVRGRK
jgi:hypothetical protein